MISTQNAVGMWKPDLQVLPLAMCDVSQLHAKL